MAIFDMAGTTINDYNLGHRTLQKVLGAHGLRIGLGEVFQHAGKGDLTAVRDILGAHTVASPLCAEDILTDLTAGLAAGYDRIGPCAFHGVEDVFKILRANGVHIVLTSGGDRETAMRLIRRMGWSLSGDFDLLVTPGDLGGDRPFPDPVAFAMDRLQVGLPGEVVRVAGSSVAIEQGVDAGCGLCVGVTTGTHTHSQLRDAGPDHILSGLSGLIRLVLRR